MDKGEIRKFGRYEVVGELGRGAMGIVYKARDPQIDRLVALKTVALRGQEPDEETEFRHRFLNEAQAAGRLHHAGIVAIFDVGEDPETRDPFIVLEYVAGEALNRLLAREKKLHLPQALQFAQEIAEALDYAHAQGVVHRDIKPGNILITESGHAKIADFGIAKLNLAHFTLPGRVLGTPAYMAPEQLSGEGVDGRSDLFSLGVILYAMATGHSPFQGNSATTVCFKVANREPIHATALNLELPRELDHIITRAMAKDPALRYQSGEALAGDLRLLRVQSEARSTSTSLPLLAPVDTRFRTGALSAPRVERAQAFASFKAALRDLPVKELLLGVATVAMLAIIGLQSKMLVSPAKKRAGIDSLNSSVAAVPSGVPGPMSPPLAVAAAAAQPDLAQTLASEPASPAARPAPISRGAKAHKTAPKTLSTTKAAAQAAVAPVAETKPVLVPLSTVELAVQHQFKDATLTVYVDDQLTLTQPLHGGAQKRLVVFNNGVRGAQSETLRIPAGQHMLRLRAQSADQTVDLSKTISADLAGGDDKTLTVTFDKHNTAMHLAWQ